MSSYKENYEEDYEENYEEDYESKSNHKRGPLHKCRLNIIISMKSDPIIDYCSKCHKLGKVSHIIIKRLKKMKQKIITKKRNKLYKEKLFSLLR